MRTLVEETTWSLRDLIAPLFVRDGGGDPEAVESMPGVFRYTTGQVIEECRRLWDAGVQAVALFPVIEPSLKDETGSYGLDEGCFLYETVRRVKAAVPDLMVINDVALDPFTNHGHDGVLTLDGAHVDNDRTVNLLAKIAVLEAQAGCDVVAPSDMMDGRVRAIRQRLDAHEFVDVAIMSYAAKFSSALYGPFREAVGSKSAAGTAFLDKRTYQVSPANGREAVKDALLDEDEGADILMVKPAGWYLDVIAALRRETRLPIAGYQISGEFSKIHAAARLGWLDLEKTRDESLLAIKRAGADMILTYFAHEIVRETSH